MASLGQRIVHTLHTVQYIHPTHVVSCDACPSCVVHLTSFPVQSGLVPVVALATPRSNRMLIQSIRFRLSRLMSVLFFQNPIAPVAAQSPHQRSVLWFSPRRFYTIDFCSNTRSLTWCCYLILSSSGPSLDPNLYHSFTIATIYLRSAVSIGLKHFDQ
jgi:hypothetical protein